MRPEVSRLVEHDMTIQLHPRKTSMPLIGNASDNGKDDWRSPT